MLWQEDIDSEGEAGLELEDPARKGTWLKARPPRGAAVINMGDMLERITNGESPSHTYASASGAFELRGGQAGSSPLCIV